MTFALRFAFVLLIATTIASCASTLRVESDPPGAEVVWSPSGTEDWRPWPPRAWGRESEEPITTPLRTRGTYGDTVWVTVRKDGYYRPLPQAVQLYSGRRESVSFDLRETPAAYAARMRDEGLVLYRGEWIDPLEEGLEEVDGIWMEADEAFAFRQRQAGLVFFDDEWMTPEEREERYAELQRARGLVEFKDRWVSPEARDNERAIDRQVAEVANAGVTPGELDPPRVVGRVDASDAQLQLVNATSTPARFLFSGPMSRSVVVEQYDTLSGLSLPPGRYSVAVIPNPRPLPVGITIDPAVPEIVRREAGRLPFYLEHPLAEGYKYILAFDGGERLDLGDLQDYEPVEPVLPMERIPEIEVPEFEIPQRQQPQRRGPPGGAARPGS